jgi:phosphatidylserine decarboxylase
MIEVVAMMIGDIAQCYSAEHYDNPLPVKTGMFLHKGAPKSLYRPGSSTDVLIFQQGRINFAEDLVGNMSSTKAGSRFSQGFGKPLVETDVRLRSFVASGISSSVHL